MRFILWVTSALTVPLPILILGPGWVPPARLLMLGGISLAVMLSESARGMVGIAAAVFLGQAVAYGALLWLAAHLLSRLLGHLPPRAVAPIVLAGVALGVAVAASFEVYHTPFAPRSARATLLEVFQ